MHETWGSDILGDLTFKYCTVLNIIIVCLFWRNMTEFHLTLDLFFLSSSYINQRNRSWNIVESEKALVVSSSFVQLLWLTADF